MRTRDGEAGFGSRHERDVRKVRAARVGIVERPHLAEGRTVLHHRGNRIGHRAEMHGNVLGLRDHATALVEERGGAIAPLLDVRGERRADEHCAHLFGHRAQEAADDLELDRHCRVSLSMRPSLAPTHPGGIQQVEPASSMTAGPVMVFSSPRGSSSSGPLRMSAVRTATN